ncbi:MAG: hypothetical protein GY757_08460 [bacterium]|nr:hypothetical protein [bacterium]
MQKEQTIQLENDSEGSGSNGINGVPVPGKKRTAQPINRHISKKSSGKFHFLNSVRIAVLSILLIVAGFLFLLADISFSPLAVLSSLVIAIILSIVNFSLFKKRRYRVALYIQSIVDLALITLLVYYTGGITSPFYFIYILPIILSAAFLNRRNTIYIATLSYILFGILSDLIYLKIIPFYPLFPDIEITLDVFVYNLVMSFVAFSCIAFLSSFYFERMKKTGAELENTRESLKDLMLLNTTVLEKMENGFIVCDYSGAVISYNEKARALLKLKNKSNVFQLFFSNSNTNSPSPNPETNPESGSISDPDSSSALFFKKKYYFEEELNERILGISYSIIEQIYSFDRIFVFIITDLTDKREIEKKLKQKEHFALIGEMSAGIAHEIRNPLASISGSVQFLSKELNLESQPEYQNLMDIIVKESTRLSNSIEVFLDYTKTTPLKRKSYDISQIIDEVVELVSLNHPEIKVIKKYSAGNFINADIRKMNQVAWNLINNAVKALKENGVIEINVYKKDGVVYLSIKDNGVGIKSEHLSKIFTPFYSGFTSGIGLGMAIVKRILDEHYFEIEIKSAKNVGTEVIICFKNK